MSQMSFPNKIIRRKKFKNILYFSDFFLQISDNWQLKASSSLNGDCKRGSPRMLFISASMYPIKCSNPPSFSSAICLISDKSSGCSRTYSLISSTVPSRTMVRSNFDWSASSWRLSMPSRNQSNCFGFNLKLLFSLE